MNKPKDLSVVVEVATHRRDNALKALARARQEWHNAELQLQQLQSYSAESEQRWAQRANQGVSALMLHTQRTFMGKLEHAVTFQNGVMQRLQSRIDQCQSEVVQAERELASLNKFLERRHTAWQHQLQRQEQRSNDEMAATQFRLHQSTTSWKAQP